MENTNFKWSSFFDLNQDKIKKFAADKPGIYLLYVKLATGRWKCFYIGKSNNIKKQLSFHLSESEQNEMIRTTTNKFICSFVFSVIQNEAERNDFLLQYKTIPLLKEEAEVIL